MMITYKEWSGQREIERRSSKGFGLGIGRQVRDGEVGIDLERGLIS